VSEDIGAQLVLGDRLIEITSCSLLADQWFILMVYWYLYRELALLTLQSTVENSLEYLDMI
jgi:hypothetical protein